MMLAEAQSQWVAIVTVVTGAIVTLGMPLVLMWIRKLEKNTNAMREAMVNNAKKTGHQEGVEEQKDKTAVTDSMKEVLAAVTAIKGGPAGAAPLHEMPAIKSLVNIEGHTAKIEENTARTDEAVTKLEDKAKAKGDL